MVSAVRRAIHDLRHLTRLWLWLYLGRLILALVITLPLLAVVGESLDRSLYGQVLTGEWSLDIINELVQEYPYFLTLYVFLAIFLGIFALLAKQFLNGGIYRALVARRLPSGGEFFSNCATDLSGHLRITAIMLPIYIGLLILASMLSAIVPRGMFGHEGIGGIISIYARVSAFWILLTLGSIFSDLMRISLALTPGRAVSTYWRSAWSLVRRVGVQAIGAYAAFYVPFVLLWIVIEFLAVQITGSLYNGLGVVLEFLLFQLCSFARSGQSLLGSAALVALSEPVPEPTPSSVTEAA